jgi:secreted trypsin-like serine protease
LVSRSVVLTAGHCVNNLLLFNVSPSQLHVDFDSTNVYTPSSSWRNVASYALMPGFQVTNGSTPDTNDIGVVILANPVEDIAPAQLAPVGFLDTYPARNTATASVLGYGLNQQLVETGNRLVTTSNVINLNDTWLKRSDTPGGTCPGDSGGPTLLIKGTTEYQIGVHSSSNGDVYFKGLTIVGCGENNYDTRVDTAAVQSFIQQQIAANP